MKPNHTLLLLLVFCMPLVLHAADEQRENVLDEEFLRFLLEFREQNGEWVDPNAVEAVMHEREMSTHMDKTKTEHEKTQTAVEK